ncbi:MAG: hypothetical protein JW749_05640 [Sedimentisphaerales bacterium]|nr:hypothetical protein [Sedimentisphaerales bacterium]
MHGRLSVERHKTQDTRRKTRRRGLSIIEVTMASVLLVVGVVPILKALTKAHMFSTMVERKTQGLVLAQGKLDEIKARSIYGFGSAGEFSETDLSLGNSYLCNVADSEVSADLRTITVEVGYDDDGDGSLEDVDVILTTYISRRW